MQLKKTKTYCLLLRGFLLEEGETGGIGKGGLPRRLRHLDHLPQPEVRVIQVNQGNIQGLGKLGVVPKNIDLYLDQYF